MALGALVKALLAPLFPQCTNFGHVLRETGKLGILSGCGHAAAFLPSRARWETLWTVVEDGRTWTVFAAVARYLRM